jgi:hypothetical protein
LLDSFGVNILSVKLYDRQSLCDSQEKRSKANPGRREQQTPFQCAPSVLKVKSDLSPHIWRQSI